MKETYKRVLVVFGILCLVLVSAFLFKAMVFPGEGGIALGKPKANSAAASYERCDAILQLIVEKTSELRKTRLTLADKELYRSTLPEESRNLDDELQDEIDQLQLKVEELANSLQFLENEKNSACNFGGGGSPKKPDETFDGFGDSTCDNPIFGDQGYSCGSYYSN